MSNQPTHDQIVYISGWFDGEGSIAFNRSGNRYRLVVGVECAYVPVLELVRDIFGGEIYLKEKRAIQYKQTYMWRLFGKEAHKFLLSILPFLMEKKDQAVLADEYCRMVGIGGGGKRRLTSEKVQQEYYYKKMQELKRIEYIPEPSVIATHDTNTEVNQLRLIGGE